MRRQQGLPAQDPQMKLPFILMNPDGRHVNLSEKQISSCDSGEVLHQFVVSVVVGEIPEWVFLRRGPADCAHIHHPVTMIFLQSSTYFLGSNFSLNVRSLKVNIDHRMAVSSASGRSGFVCEGRRRPIYGFTVCTTTESGIARDR
jgi:hypothetical protein